MSEKFDPNKYAQEAHESAMEAVRQGRLDDMEKSKRNAEIGFVGRVGNIGSFESDGTKSREDLRKKGWKNIAAAGYLALASVSGAGVVAEHFHQSQADFEPKSWGEYEQVEVSEHGANVIESPDGTRYQGVWLDGSTGQSWAELGLNSKETEQVLAQNGLDAVPNEPTTIFVEESLIPKSE